ncbi:MAG: mannose-1-phosphate guanylyltransferase [Clostridium perfringens]|nr:mannose-1-phosphate guanylyltransferase [Clostridium perfringens]
MLCALIMAGGKGTRFWPLSTADKPKQFLKLLGSETMIQMTINRINKQIPLNRVFVCTTEGYVDLVKEQLPNLPIDNIIVEPEGRNTAPCIALSAMVIKRRFKDANMVVLPSDHLIRDEEDFLESIKCANNFLNVNKEAIITLGMKPDRVETGYGYIKIGKDSYEKNIKEVHVFVEKPTWDKARNYLESNEYLWNGGMFLWNIDNIISLIEEFLPKTYEALKPVLTTREDKIYEEVKKNYNKTDAISIDYGILEKAKNIYVIPCDCGWDDVGNWTSVERYSDKDDVGNVFKAQGTLYNSKNNIVLTHKNILLNDVENLIVVETDDYIMISSKKQEQDIKKAKELLGGKI